MRNFTYVHLSWWLETFNIEYLQWAYLLVGKPPRTAFVSLFSWARFPERTFLIFGLAAKILGEGRDKEGKNLRGAHCSRCRCSQSPGIWPYDSSPLFPVLCPQVWRLCHCISAHAKPLGRVVATPGCEGWAWTPQDPITSYTDFLLIPIFNPLPRLSSLQSPVPLNSATCGIQKKICSLFIDIQHLRF